MKSMNSGSIPFSQYTLGGTNISHFITAFIGVVATALFYAILPLIQNTNFAMLFYHRGWVPIAEVFLTSWAISMLILKGLKYKTQANALIYDILPVTPEKIMPEDVPLVLNHIMALPRQVRQSLLANRIQRSLRHYQFRKNRNEIATFLSSQSEIDFAVVDSSFSMLKVLIWAIPILGFIGTVLGIGQSIDGFSNLSDISKLQSSLQQITEGLGGAFDTTLLALIFSILIMFPSSSLQKSEQDLLTRIDEYCNEHLICRLEENNPYAEEISKKISIQMIEIFKNVLPEIGEIIGKNIKKHLEQHPKL